jgi:hypothetical protein
MLIFPFRRCGKYRMLVWLLVHMMKTEAKIAEGHSRATSSPVVVPSGGSDGQLEKHDMFQDDYQQVILLLRIHQVLAIQKNRKRCGVFPAVAKFATVNSSKRQRFVNKRARQAIDA